MAFKTLHEFTVTLERPVKEVKVEEKDGQKVTTENTVTKDVPYTLILKELSRRERQEITLFQSIQYNDAVGKGLLPRLVMQQKIGKETGNPLSEEEDKNLNAMTGRLRELANDYLQLSQNKDLPDTAEVNERKQKIIMEYMVLSKRVIDINAAYESVYAYTAESYMQNKTLTWLVLFLTFIKDSPEATPRPMFNGTSFEAKEQAWADLDEGQDLLYHAAFKRLSQYWGLFYRGECAESKDFVNWDESEKKREEYEKKMREEAAKIEVDKLKVSPLPTPPAPPKSESAPSASDEPPAAPVTP